MKWPSSVVRGVVNPLQTLDRRNVLSNRRSRGSQGGGGIPRRAEVVLGEAAIKEHVTGGGANVLDVVLNTAADNRKSVDGAPGVDQTTRTTLRNGGEGTVDFQIPVRL